MEFGIFSNGFRPHTDAGHTYDEDIAEIVLADRLGFRDAYISEHHGEPSHIGKVDTIPAPELMMCKAAALTRRIRMGAAVKLIHLHHPLDVAIQAAVTDHLIGGGRYIFGFGTGFGNPAFCLERGLSFEDRHPRLREALDMVLKCWSTEAPFDWDGAYWHGKGVLCLPKPVNGRDMPMATATDSDDMIILAAERGYTLLASQIDTAANIRRRTELYTRHAKAVGRTDPLSQIAAARVVYLADSRRDAIEDMRAGVAYEVDIQAQRGFLKMMKQIHGVEVPNNNTAIDFLAESGLYMVGEPDEVAAQIASFHAESGGFGEFLIVTGKAWSTSEKRARSMRLFMDQVAPKLSRLDRGVQSEPPGLSLALS